MKEAGAKNDGGRTMHSAPLYRNVSNQSTIDSGSHLAPEDPQGRGIAAGGGQPPEKQRRLRLLLDQCETVRFPFKKKLVLANLDLSCEELPQLISERLGAGLQKLSLSGNRLGSIPELLIRKLTGLRALDLSQCNLYCIPDVWALGNLKILNLSNNCLKPRLPEVRYCGRVWLTLWLAVFHKLSRSINALPSKDDCVHYSTNSLSSPPREFSQASLSCSIST